MHNTTDSAGWSQPWPFHIPVNDIAARIKSTSDRVDNFLRHQSTAVTTTSAEVQHESQRHAESVQELKEAIAKHRELLNNSKQRLPALDDEVSKRREMLEACRQKKNAEIARQTIIRERRDKLREAVAQKKEEIQAKTDPSADETRLRVQAELDVISKSLKFRASGKGDNTVKFTFTSIDEHDHDRKYYFVLHLPPHEPFSVLECVPSIPDLPQLVSRLNSDRNIYTFIARMRGAFGNLDTK